MAVKDYYSILGVHRTAPAADIKRSYHRLAVTYHPDKNPDPAVAERFKEINEAYDVVGDAEKRRLYDLQREYLVGQLVQAPPQASRHRDPAYRRRRQAPPVARAATPKELMRQYLPYFRWLTLAGLILTVLLAIDLVLPYDTTTEKITRIYKVTSRRNGFLYHLIVTESGKKFRMYEHKGSYFYDEAAINVVRTKMFSTVMEVSNESGEHVSRAGYIYSGGLQLFPMVLFVVSLLGVVMRKRTEFVFNASIVCGLLIVILLYQIFTL